MDLSKAPAASSSVPRDPDTLSLQSSDFDSMLLGSSSHHDKDEEVHVVGDDDESVSTELLSAAPSRTYRDMLDVMKHAIKRLDLA